MAKKFKNPFVSFTHAIRHCLLFLRASPRDRFVANPLYDANTENPVSVYCVHGTADRSEGFNMLAERLKWSLPSNVKGFHLVTFERRARGISIDEFASQLTQKIKQHGDQRVVLMGHSRGGLIAAEVGTALKKEGKIAVDAVIPICAPFQGSYLVKKHATCCSRSVKQMSVGSDYLQSLNEKVQQSHLRFRFFGAEKDRVVKGNSFMPPHLTRPAKNVTLYDRHGHLSILSSWRLRDHLVELFHDLYAGFRKADQLADICEAPLPDFLS